VTHTLHRQGEIGSLKKDYVVMVMAAQKFDDSGSSEKVRKRLNSLPYMALSTSEAREEESVLERQKRNFSLA